MVDGTRLSKIENELSRIEAQNSSFQECMAAQMTQLMSLLQKKKSDDENLDAESTHSILQIPARYSTTRISTKDFKIDLPKFDGINVDDWIFHFEEYFDVAQTPLEQCIKVASFYMIGPAYVWYKWMIHKNYSQDWTIFVDALYKHFGSNLYTNPQEALTELKQQGTVKEYQTQFEALSTRVNGLTKQWLVSFFVAGLNDYLKCQLRLTKPPSYHEAVALALLHEQNYATLQKSLTQSSIFFSYFYTT